MKTRKVDIEKLFEVYDHPAAVLFRAIELNSIYEMTKDIDFKEPSLDIGCGDGVISELLFDSKFTYGIDNGEAHDVEEAVKHNRYGKVLLESAEKMSLPNESLNFAFSNSVIEHIPNNGAVLSEVSRTLKPGGYFLFTSPSRLFGKYLYFTNLFNKIGLRFLADMYESKRNKMLNHYHILDHEIYGERLATYGLELITYSYCVSKPAMVLWDKIAIISFIGRIFNKRANSYLTELFKNKVVELANNARDNKSIEANLVILSKKI